MKAKERHLNEDTKFFGSMSLEKLATRLTSELRSISAQKRIARVIHEYAPDVAVSTSFGPTSAVLLHMASSILPGIRVINIRHGYETPRTLIFAEECRRQFDIDLRIYQSPQILAPEWGTPEFDAFCRQIKIEPMHRALIQEGIKIWFAGLIHDETSERRRMRLSQARRESIAVYPILDWCFQDAALYCETHGLKMNHDYFDPCKGPGQKRECGLHSTMPTE